MASRDRDDHATRGREFSPRESEPRAFVSAADRGNLVTGGLASLSFDDRFSRGGEREEDGARLRRNNETADSPVLVTRVRGISLWRRWLNSFRSLINGCG